MKKTTLLLLTSLAVLAVNASAAQNQTDDDVVVLPTYQVTTPRYQPAEKKVNESLAALRQQAQAPMVLAPDVPGLRKLALQEQTLERAAVEVKTLQLAKL
ncbi:MAG TPA: hypothetical protein VG936_11695 [Lacunisphaera sp.]|nr:hypothetical protein [Lacunisphaera sp.]